MIVEYQHLEKKPYLDALPTGGRLNGDGLGGGPTFGGGGMNGTNGTGGGGTGGFGIPS